MSVIVRAPAKINLQLSVGPLRDDGFHELVSVFHAVSLVDVITAQRGEGVHRAHRDVELGPALLHTSLFVAVAKFSSFLKPDLRNGR